MDKSSQLTRICSSCGVQKPLSAFLQLGGTQGTTYGTICSDCRRSVLAPKQPPSQKEGDESTKSGFRIGAKAKITADLEKKRQFQDLKESHQIEKRRREELKEKTEVTKEIKEKAEKDHRRFYIETKKQGFLSETKQTPTAKQAMIARKVGAKLPAARLDEKSMQVEAKKLEDLIEQELQQTTIDLTIPYLDPQFAEIRYHSSLFLQFKQWLGGASPIGKLNALKNLQQLYKHKETPAVTKDPLIDYIEKSWGPSKRR